MCSLRFASRRNAFYQLALEHVTWLSLFLVKRAEARWTLSSLPDNPDLLLNKRSAFFSSQHFFTRRVLFLSYLN